MHYVKKLHWSIARACRKSEFYTLLHHDCGATDGGCVVVAEALHNLIPGSAIKTIFQTWSLTYDRGGNDWTTVHGRSWKHAVLELPCGLYLDGDGVATGQQLCQRWEETQLWMPGAAVIDDPECLDTYRETASFGEPEVVSLTAYFGRVLELAGFAWSKPWSLLSLEAA